MYCTKSTDHTLAYSPIMANNSYNLAIGELVVYLPIAPLLLFVLIRHARVGPTGMVGWVYTLVFIGLQLASAGIIIGSGKNKFSSTGTVLSQIGLSPLFLATMGVLHERLVTGRPVNHPC